jgi:hypothetical protein
MSTQLSLLIYKSDGSVVGNRRFLGKYGSYPAYAEWSERVNR